MLNVLILVSGNFETCTRKNFSVWVTVVLCSYPCGNRTRKLMEIRTDSPSCNREPVGLSDQEPDRNFKAFFWNLLYLKSVYIITQNLLDQSFWNFPSAKCYNKLKNRKKILLGLPRETSTLKKRILNFLFQMILLRVMMMLHYYKYMEIDWMN